MNRLFPHLAELDIAAKMSDLKEHNYQQTLLLSSLLELLLERGFLTIEEVQAKAAELEAEDAAAAIPPLQHPTP